MWEYLVQGPFNSTLTDSLVILVAQIVININNDNEVGANIKRIIGFKSESYFEFLNKSLIDPFNRNIQDEKWPFHQIASFGFFGADMVK